MKKCALALAFSTLPLGLLGLLNEESSHTASFSFTTLSSFYTLFSLGAPSFICAAYGVAHLLIETYKKEWAKKKKSALSFSPGKV